MKVYIPTPLRSYTGQARVIEATGSTVGELLAAIGHRYPGFRFRIIDEQDNIREHIKIFVGENQTLMLSTPLRSDDVIHIICALSGGRGGYMPSESLTHSTGSPTAISPSLSTCANAPPRQF